MNKRQTDKYGSFIASVALLEATPEINDIAGLAPRVATAKANVSAIGDMAQTQTLPLDGVLEGRGQVLTAMRDAALDIAGKVSVYAEENKRPELARAVALTEADFQAARLMHQPWLAQRVHDATLPVLAQLAAFAVNADDLADLQTKITAAEVALSRPRTTVARKRSASQQLAALIKETDELFERQIDPLVRLLRKTNPEFYAAYRATREIVDSGGRKTPKPEAPTAPAGRATTATPTSSEKLAA